MRAALEFRDTYTARHIIAQRDTFERTRTEVHGEYSILPEANRAESDRTESYRGRGGYLNQK